jgi:hypothetical protein
MFKENKMATAEQIQQYIFSNVKNANNKAINNMIDRFNLKMVVGKKV